MGLYLKKCLFLFIAASFSVSSSFAQIAVQALQPFIIQGQLLNYPSNELHLTFRNKNGKVDKSIAVDNTGKFYFKCPPGEVNGPLPAKLSQQDIFRASLFIAPGYNLTITADCANSKWGSAVNKHIDGYGADANQYLFLLDSVLLARNDTRNWYQLNAIDLIAYENLRKLLCDSILKLVFSQKPAPDEYYKYFKEYTQLSNKFERIDHITYHTVVDSTLHYQQAIDYVARNIDTGVFTNMFSPKYLALDTYRDFMLNGYYQYRYGLEFKYNPLNIDKNHYRIDAVSIIDHAYQDSIKYIALYSQMHDALEFSRSWDELKMYENTFPRYIAELPDEDKKGALKALFNTKESELVITQVGKAAPEFTAQDSLGKAYNLTDYKGKVVLLDLWASWCGPCRYQTPYLEKIVEKYKADDRMVFMSVAVLDERDKWKTALAHDKPTWLQLFDNNNVIPTSYASHSIPKFILISKQGNIVSFDTPMPSDSDLLVKLLDAELSK